MTKSRRPDTDLIHADREIHPDRHSVAPAIWPTSTFRAATTEEFEELAGAVRPPRFYSRYGNPTHRHAEELIAAAEGAEACLLGASGMGIMSTTLLALLRAGDHLVVQRQHYGGTSHLAAEVLPRFGIESTAVDQRDLTAVAAAMRMNTKVVVAESPSNPVLAITDIRGVAAIANAGGAVLVVDNTFATPVNQQPLRLGAHLVMHSATKYLGGHSDLLAGAVAGSSELVECIWRMSIALGASLGPFEAWLLARGIRTLALRVARHNDAAMRVARLLAKHPAVLEVNYPGLEDHPQHALARSQMTGFGGILSMRVRGGVQAAERVLGGLHLFSRAPSLGGVESLAIRPSAMLAGLLSEEEFERRGVHADLIRLSIGLEDPQDLIDDLDGALTAANEVSSRAGTPVAAVPPAARASTASKANGSPRADTAETK